MMSDVIGDQTADRTAQLRILGSLAALALLLACVGIHGLLAFTVARARPCAKCCSIVTRPQIQPSAS
jgi:hypothetical protein